MTTQYVYFLQGCVTLETIRSLKNFDCLLGQLLLHLFSSVTTRRTFSWQLSILFLGLYPCMSLQFTQASDCFCVALRVSLTLKLQITWNLLNCTLKVLNILNICFVRESWWKKNHISLLSITHDRQRRTLFNQFWWCKSTHLDLPSHCNYECDTDTLDGLNSNKSTWIFKLDIADNTLWCGEKSIIDTKHIRRPTYQHRVRVCTLKPYHELGTITDVALISVSINWFINLPQLHIKQAIIKIN